MVDLVFPSRPHLLLVALSLAVCSLSANVSQASSMDVVLVVDTSGSMAWDVEGRRKSDASFQGPPRIGRVIDALKSYADKLPDGTRLRLISFNSGVKTNKEFTVSEANRGDLIATISQLKGQVGSGDTWLWEAMREGIKAAESYAAQDPDLTVTFYVLTDGEQDNKDPNREKNISLAKVLGASNALGGESLYGSLVLLGKRKSQGGAFRDEYLKQLKEEAGTKCDVQLDEDFNPLFPAILDAPERALPGVKTKVYEVSGGNFSKVEWLLDGKLQPSQQRNLEFIPPKPGRYIVTFKGYDTKDRRARARIALDIGQTPVKAIPRISIDGKPFDSVDTIIQGQRMDLSHDSLGPVAKVTWNVNGNQTEAATLNSVLNDIGPYKISLTVESAPDPTGQVTESTSQPIVFEVVAPRLLAQPEVSVDGKTLAEVGAIHPGATLTLVSKNTANAQSFDWQIGEEQLSGQTVTWQVPAAGTYNIVHTVGGAEASDTAAPISLTVVNPELAAVAEVMYEGRPLAEADNVYTGRTLLLVSKSTGPVKQTIWTIDGKEVHGNTVSHVITAPGQLAIELTVKGETADQTSSSGITRVLAKNPPPMWMLWALGLFELALLGLLAYFFSGNRLRDSRVQVEGGRAQPVKKHWSRLHKEARIFVGKILPGEYWRKRDRKEAILVTPVPVTSGPPGALSCTFKSAMAGVGAVSMDEDPTRRTPTEIYYDLIDERDEDQKQSVGISLQILKPTRTDTLLLLLSAAALAVIFITFLIKVYPTLH